jgi:hypothetical protein
VEYQRFGEHKQTITATGRNFTTPFIHTTISTTMITAFDLTTS